MALGQSPCEQARADLAAATQEAIVDVLVSKSVAALKQTGLRRLVVAGGVGANRVLRERLQGQLRRLQAEAYFPPLDLCTDNGAMIAFAAAQRVQRGLVDLGPQSHGFNVSPRWDLAEI
jgi:N6-L-threonylcarbamoyladenine synthase